MTCCRCNRTGTYKNCSCTRSDKTCTNYLPGRLNNHTTWTNVEQPASQDSQPASQDSQFNVCPLSQTTAAITTDKYNSDECYDVQNNAHLVQTSVSNEDDYNASISHDILNQRLPEPYLLPEPSFHYYTLHSWP